MFFESHRWRLYETRQVNRWRRKPSKSEKGQGRMVPGEVSPGKPDFNGDVARGAENFRRCD
jgi:hypothetical protein